MTTAEVAEHLGIPAETLRYWRHKGTGPKSFRLGEKLVRYRREDVDHWVAEQVAAAEPRTA
ncbi:helix-turn-helix transcriptional regulator [Georgenia wangjunii]|uniref:helix-turn-helix transcriptional regulator n=1 Tax=Georgenia wangjunii TaxID=3117730 RepID=UPI002F26C244